MLKDSFPSPENMDLAARLAVERAAGESVHAAIAGGYAMQHYGSPRLTKDVDLIANGPPPFPIKGPLVIGGFTTQGPAGVEVDWILREDEYGPLYAEALENAGTTPDGLPIIRPEYMAAMKFATRESKHEGDVVFLLQSGLVGLDKTRHIIHRLVGGRFAVDEFNLLVAEAEWKKSAGLGW